MKNFLIESIILVHLTVNILSEEIKSTTANDEGAATNPDTNPEIEDLNEFLDAKIKDILPYLQSNFPGQIINIKPPNKYFSYISNLISFEVRNGSFSDIFSLKRMGDCTLERFDDDEGRKIKIVLGLEELKIAYEQCIAKLFLYEKAPFFVKVDVGENKFQVELEFTDKSLLSSCQVVAKSVQVSLKNIKVQIDITKTKAVDSFISWALTKLIDFFQFALKGILEQLIWNTLNSDNFLKSDLIRPAVCNKFP